MKKRVAIIGSGGHAGTIFDLLSDDCEYSPHCFIDLVPKVSFKLGIPVRAEVELIHNHLDYQPLSLVMGCGSINGSSTLCRAEIFCRFQKRNWNFISVIASDSTIVKSAKVGEGAFIGHRALVNSNAELGVNVLINSGAIVEHDVIIDDHTHISTGVIVNGGVSIGKSVFVGSGAIIFPGISIGDGAVIGAGSVVRQDVSPHSRVVIGEFSK
ncbi:acetyltransferase [Litorivicinus sp.]|nr:acetyltransferase [Litorivicinus sp.]